MHQNTQVSLPSNNPHKPMVRVEPHLQSSLVVSRKVSFSSAISMNSSAGTSSHLGSSSLHLDIYLVESIHNLTMKTLYTLEMTVSVECSARRQGRECEDVRKIA